VQKVIVYVWVNDAESLRAYGSKTDAYALFQKMLASGYPPGSFEELLKQSREI
jgi:toxin YhaV